jgi:UDP-N-acetyl-D-mannosaminuronate dehydrogenase
MKIGIIGHGEIGSSLHKVYAEFSKFNIVVVDPNLGLNDDINNCDILNICIPYFDNFVDIVNEYITKSNPKLTVIHSTVAPNTTSKIEGKVCHSPVRGLHPNLDTGIKTFVKWIGSEDISTALEYQNHLKELNVNSYVCKNSKTTEYAKLLDTTYYGVCIAFHNDVLDLCEKEEINFDEVMTNYNQTYNLGYQTLGKHNVIRPVLYGGKKIGGHCVIPNAKILKEYMDTQSLSSILKYE